MGLQDRDYMRERARRRNSAEQVSGDGVVVKLRNQSPDERAVVSSLQAFLTVALVGLVANYIYYERLSIHYLFVGGVQDWFSGLQKLLDHGVGEGRNYNAVYVVWNGIYYYFLFSTAVQVTVAVANHLAAWSKNTPPAGRPQYGGIQSGADVAAPEASAVTNWVLSGFDSRGRVVRLTLSNRRADGTAVPERRLVLGRHSQDCDLFIDDSGVSRRHVEFVIRPDGGWLRDLGSANGTLLDGKPVPNSQYEQLPETGSLTLGELDLMILRTGI
jgi:hypothetical protein